MGAARPRPLRTDYAGDARKGSAASRGDEWGWREAESALTGGYKLLSSLQKARVPESSAFPLVCVDLLGVLLIVDFDLAGLGLGLRFCMSY